MPNVCNLTISKHPSPRYLYVTTLSPAPRFKRFIMLNLSLRLPRFLRVTLSASSLPFVVHSDLPRNYANPPAAGNGARALARKYAFR